MAKNANGRNGQSDGRRNAAGERPSTRTKLQAQHVKGTMLHRVPNPVLCAGRSRSSMMRAAAAVAVWLLAAAPLLSAGPAIGPAMAAENNPPAPPADQQAGAKGDAKVELRLDAQHKVNGPAGNPECYELGTN